ncbi:MAG: 50S ribosomal protein L18e [Candidatus Pacearchaeota archaeon]
MKSKTKISKQIERKTSAPLVETIINAQKEDKWKRIAEILSGSRKRMIDLNLSEIDSLASEGEKLVIPGKVLSQGNVNKKIEIVALSFSGKAIEKLSESKIPFSTINEEIKKNPEGKKIKILGDKK